ncbi:MAG: RraA family protein [Alphaproteobacteria bacterium]
MIKDPPVLTVRRNFPRPTADQVAALGGVPTGYLVDAMGGRGALLPPIGPADLSSPLPTRFCGPALTSNCGPADVLALMASLSFIRPGDVLVAAADGFTATAVTGDLVLGAAKNAGAVGFVTDGCIRDLEGCIAVGLPVHCAGVTPNSPAKVGPGSVGLPITLGGQTVQPGDVIAADRDGVVVVPLAKIEAVIAALADVRAAEAELDAKVKGGLRQFAAMEGLLKSDRVEYLD